MLENHSLRVSFALPLRFDTIVAARLLLAAFDPTFPTGYSWSIPIRSMKPAYLLKQPVFVLLLGPLG
jgi:hypothetical protein